MQAMGENLNDGVEGEAEDSKQRRLKLIAAVEGDNWSGVIDAQTAEAVVSAAPRCLHGSPLVSCRTAAT